jgi:hypothetical protein
MHWVQALAALRLAGMAPRRQVAREACDNGRLACYKLVRSQSEYGSDFLRSVSVESFSKPSATPSM